MRKVLVLITTAVLVVLMGSSAQATIRDINDPAGDLVKVIEGDNGEAHHYERVSRAEGDIVFTRVQHTGTAVVFYMRFRQLTVPKQYADFIFRIYGNNGRGVEASINTRHGDPQGNSNAYEEVGAGPECAHSSHINYAGDSAWMRIARRCLKNPKYVRVQAWSAQRRESPTGAITRYFDSPTRDGLNNLDQLEETWTPWVVTD